jgi:hypothetical protein
VATQHVHAALLAAAAHSSWHPVPVLAARLLIMLCS